MKRLFYLLAALALTALAFVWMQSGQAWNWRLPPDIPPPVVPSDNPMNQAKVELGRWLFYDTRLSGNQTMACATCHIQELAFSDGKPRSIGSTGAIHPRSAMSLVNVAYASRLTWANPLLDRLEDQALIPLLGDNPVEMGLGGQEERVGALLRNDANYSRLARTAFPRDEDPHSLLNGVRAISAFVRTIIGFDSAYDRYLRGNAAALSASAKRGMELFFSERLECFHCHGGFNFTDSTSHANSNIDRVGYHNTGLYNLDGAGAYPADNTGLFDMTGERRDMGRFRAPSLRNIAVTGPYMHDGSVPNLEAVIAHYERGGRLLEAGAFSGDGRLNPFKSEFIAGFELNDQERDDLVAFLEALTDQSLLTAERLSNPFLN